MPSGSVQILATKLQPPRTRPSSLERSRLSAGAARVLDVPLTLVSAPAGFGKTTLLVEWYEWLGHRATVGWVSLDEFDSDPQTFGRYLQEALCHAFGDVPGVGDQLTLEALVAHISNRSLAEGSPVVLILDDYHLIESSRIDAAVQFLLERMPSDMHVVLGSRRNPNVPLARLRARGRLFEVAADDLRFTVEETRGLFNDLEQLNLTAEQLATLESRTEGWAAALQLAALSVKGKDNPDRFIRTFSGSQRFVFDYLAEEVFGAQDEQTQAFLVQTSVLDRMTGPLCDAVTLTPSGGARLTALNRASLFTVALDDADGWFRYHHLFRDFLRGMLAEREPENIASLNRRASEWFVSDGLLEEAVPYAVASGDQGWAFTIIERVLPAATLRGDIFTPVFDRWMEAVSHQEVERRPWAALPLAFARALAGRVTEAADLAQCVEDVLEERTPAAVELTDTEKVHYGGVLNLVRAYIARFRGDPEAALALVDHSATLLPQADSTQPWLRMFRQLVLHDAWAPNRESELRDAATNCFEKGHPAAANALLVLEFYRLALSGHLNAASDHLEASLKRAYERNALPSAGMLHGVAAELFYQRGELDEAEEEAQRCISLGAPGASAGLFFPPEASLVLIQNADGRREEALASLHLLEGRIKGVETVQGQLFFPALVAHLHFLLGLPAIAERWAESSTLSPETQPTFALEYPCLVYARVLVVSGRAKEAIPLLRRVADAAYAAGRHGRTLEAQVIEACALWREGDERSALIAFGRLLPLAERERYVRVILDEGEPALSLLRKSASAGAHAPYALRLLLAAGGNIDERRPRLATRPDDLSARELEVLRLLALGSFNREIADELVISLDTVKSHLRSVYAKLDVHSRGQAVRSARERGLV
ncbi:MAG: LuxR C-terminal-related transcriptional regulator [Tepidiformaceae bacterium]